MMLQHKEISKMRQSADFYRHKINKYRRRAKEATPTLDEGGRSGRSSPGTDHLLYSDHESSAAPSEHLDDSFTSSLLRGSHSSAITGMLERSRSASKTTPTISAGLPGSSTSQVTVTPETVRGGSPRIVVRGAR